MTYDQTTRPAFYESQYLGSDDLNAIVDYGHTQFARHILGGHAWGIAAGLQLVENSTGASSGQVQMFIEPGYAWDGFGRSIVVLSPVQIPESLFSSAHQTGTPYPMQIWLQYQETSGLAAAPGFAQCNTTNYSTVQESYQIVVGPQTDQQDPISFAGYSVAAGSIISALNSTSTAEVYDSSIPAQTFPDPPGGPIWLVPLGYVLWQPAAGATPGMFLTRVGANVPTDSSVRVDIGVIAGSVLAAENTIEIRKRISAPSCVLSDDLVWIDGSLRVAGNIRSFGGALKFLNKFGDGDPGPIAPFCKPTPPPAATVPPLMIQREDCSSGNSYLEIIIGQGTPKEFKGTNSLQIGPLDAKSGKIDPGLTLLDTGCVGIGNTNPQVPLSFGPSAGDLISLYQDSPPSPVNYYGVGVDNSNKVLQIYCDQSSSNIAFGWGSSKNFNQAMSITGGGTLTVVGDILLAKGPLYAPGSMDKLLIVCGTVTVDNGTGAIDGTSGSGFTATAAAPGAGYYTINFNPAFQSAPSGSITQVYLNPNGYGGFADNTGGDTRDNTVIISITPTQVYFKTGDSSGTPAWRSFTFIFAGGR